MMKNEETRIHRKITYQEVDFVGHYRLANLFSTLADLATINALSIGIWKADLQQQYGWILTKQTMVLHRPISINEDITFSTRAGSSSRIQFTRLYDIYDARKQCIGGVFSTWTFIDIQKRKMIRPDKVGIVIPKIEVYPHAVDTYQKIKEGIAMECRAKRTVVYSDIDVNQHMNNYRYIEWAMDVIDYQMFETHFISDVSMAFKKELVPNTKTRILYGHKGTYFKVCIVSEDESILYFEMGGNFKRLDIIKCG